MSYFFIQYKVTDYHSQWDRTMSELEEFGYTRVKTKLVEAARFEYAVEAIQEQEDLEHFGHDNRYEVYGFEDLTIRDRNEER